MQTADQISLLGSRKVDRFAEEAMLASLTALQVVPEGDGHKPALEEADHARADLIRVMRRNLRIGLRPPRDASTSIREIRDLGW